MSVPDLAEACAFDLPEWLNAEEITWRSLTGLRTAHVVLGELTGESGHRLACDLLAVDEAYPEVVADGPRRVLVHRAWRNGEVDLVWRESRLSLALPGTRVEPGQVLEALSRLARAVGASPERWSVTLRIGEDRGARRPR